MIKKVDEILLKNELCRMYKFVTVVTYSLNTLQFLQTSEEKTKENASIYSFHSETVRHNT